MNSCFKVEQLPAPIVYTSCSSPNLPFGCSTICAVLSLLGYQESLIKKVDWILQARCKRCSFSDRCRIHHWRYELCTSGGLSQSLPSFLLLNFSHCPYLKGGLCALVYHSGFQPMIVFRNGSMRKWTILALTCSIKNLIAPISIVALHFARILLASKLSTLPSSPPSKHSTKKQGNVDHRVVSMQSANLWLQMIFKSLCRR